MNCSEGICGLDGARWYLDLNGWRGHVALAVLAVDLLALAVVLTRHFGWWPR